MTETHSIYSVIGSPLILGTVSLICCMAFFGLAIHYDWIEDLAPRAANRPKAVMKNSILSNINDSSKYKNKHKIYVYPIAWIKWAYNLTYRQCINGIPGTGTRNDGWSGPLLKINLDAVILLKFHTLLFKIAVLVAVLCLFILIPINTTAGCDVELFGNGTCTQHENKRHGFYKTTIANIPNKIVSSVLPILFMFYCSIFFVMYNTVLYCTALLYFTLLNGNYNALSISVSINLLITTRTY